VVGNRDYQARSFAPQSVSILMNAEFQLPDVFRMVMWAAGILYVGISVVTGALLLGGDSLIAGDGGFREWLDRLHSVLLVFLFPESDRALETVKKYVSDYGCFPPPLEYLVKHKASLVQQFVSTVRHKKQVVLMGRSGSGKTTFALEMCRRYLTTGAEQPTRQIPVFVRLSLASRFNGLSSMVVHLVSQSVGTCYPFRRQWLARRMLDKGELFLVFDEIDYLGIRGRDELKEFASRSGGNSFLYIVSKRAYPHDFLDNVSGITMPEWETDEVEEYIRGRIKEEPKRRELIHEFKKGRGIFRQHLTPLEWKHLVDLYLEGRSLEALSRQGPEDALVFELLDRYFHAVLKTSEIEYTEAIREFGRLSLMLIKRGRSSFALAEAEDAGVRESHLRRLTGKVFEGRGTAFAFVHPNHQVFFAGKYLGQFWSEARTDLEGSEVKALIWAAVCSCAGQFIPKDQAEDLRNTFRRLSENESEAASSRN
jgi:energy-coupling factor transporter ATP-binding protein EcfA2